MYRWLAGILILGMGIRVPGSLGADKAFDAAAAFGARESVADISLSPDGQSIAFVSPTEGAGTAVYTLSLAQEGAKPSVALTVDGKPMRLGGCEWVSNSRLVCNVYGVVVNKSMGELLPFTRLVAVEADGKNLKLLSTREQEYSRGLQLGGGNVIDALPDEDGVVLMTRRYLPNDHTGTLVASKADGLGVDRIDTRTLQVANVELANPEAMNYLSDGQGVVRVMMVARKGNARGQQSGIVASLYRTPGSRDWRPLGEFNTLDRSGFWPLAVDSTLNVVYGHQKLDGRMALYAISLDGNLREQLIYARDDVDVGGLVSIGRKRRPVGVHYDLTRGHVHYFDPDIEAMHEALAKALPALPSLSIIDSSNDESKLLVFASADNNPGMFYLFDRKARQLRVLLAARDPLVDAPLASVRPVQYRAADGTLIPGYLTVPPGEKDPKSRPAIVLPHGGPAARDYWAFDWLPQYFAARGFVVLQPNFRGSSGYGDAWFEKNGFKSWPVAVGDVLDAGRWLVAQGIADPAKLAVVGWSYGGYAALQSTVVDSNVFKAVVAIAPVTDLAALKEESRNWSNYELVSEFVGDGPHVREGSPIENAAKIKVPVLLFHGGHDRNVNVLESKRMAERLKSVGGRCELVTWPDLDHQLEDSQARTEMLRKSDEFLRQVLGM